jgi:hypothetical protein
MRYIHFTSPEDAEKILTSQQLWKSSYVDAIFAVAEGGAFQPTVQNTSMGRTKDRSVAIVFETDDLPDVAYPEEVIWHMDVLPIKNPEVMLGKDAIKLLDGSIPVNSDDWLMIPLHPSKKDPRTLERIRLPKGVHETAVRIAANLMHKERLRKLRRS